MSSKKGDHGEEKKVLQHVAKPLWGGSLPYVQRDSAARLQRKHAQGHLFLGGSSVWAASCLCNAAAALCKRKRETHKDPVAVPETPRVAGMCSGMWRHAENLMKTKDDTLWLCAQKKKG